MKKYLNALWVFVPAIIFAFIFNASEVINEEIRIVHGDVVSYVEPHINYLYLRHYRQRKYTDSYCVVELEDGNRVTLNGDVADIANERKDLQYVCKYTLFKWGDPNIKFLELLDDDGNSVLLEEVANE